MIENIKNIIGVLDKEWLKREYIFSFLFLIVATLSSSGPYSSTLNLGGILLLLIPCFLFYPFARFMYNVVTDFFFKNIVFMMSISNFFLTKFITFVILWYLSIPIGIIAMIYIHFKYNKK